MTDVSNSADVLDVRDIIERFEELEGKREALDAATEAVNELLSDPAHQKKDLDKARDTRQDAEDDFDAEEQEELATLKSLLEDLESNGGDHQWRGSWYPVSLIRDSYFEDYARELADDIGAINKDAGWPNSCIDWEKAADELKMDYSTVEYGGIDYWYR